MEIGIKWNLFEWNIRVMQLHELTHDFPLILNTHVMNILIGKLQMAH